MIAGGRYPRLFINGFTLPNAPWIFFTLPFAGLVYLSVTRFRGVINVSTAFKLWDKSGGVNGPSRGRQIKAFIGRNLHIRAEVVQCGKGVTRGLLNR